MRRGARGASRGGGSGGGMPRGARQLFGVLFGFGVVFVMEGMARISGAQPAYQADLIGGWTMLPEMHDSVMSNQQDGHEFRVTTNADGLRTSLTVEKKPGVKRVALLGDSTTFGWGANEGGTLADGLASAWPEGEVLNAGQPGYSTSQIADFFEAIVAKYQPDLSVVFLPMHDHNLVLVSDREHLDGAAGPFSGTRVLLAKHSALYQVLRQAIFPLAGEQFALPWAETRGEPRVPRVSDAERADNVLGMKALAASWGGRVALGHIPFGGDFEGQKGERLGAAWAEEFAKENDIPLVDLRDCCRGDNLTLEWDPGHLTAEGNLMAGKAAGAIVRKILAEAR